MRSGFEGQARPDSGRKRAGGTGRKRAGGTGRKRVHGAGCKQTCGALAAATARMALRVGLVGVLMAAAAPSAGADDRDALPARRILLPPGAPAREDSARAVASIDSQINRFLHDALARGFPMTRMQIDSVVLGDSIELWCRELPGPRARVRQVQFSGSHRTRERFLRRVVGFEPGRTFRSEEALLAREALEDTELFERVAGPYVLLPEDDGIGGGHGAEIDLLFDLEGRPVNRLTGILGYSGADERLYGYVDVLLGNLFGTGRVAQMRWQGQEDLESSFHLSWHEPYLFQWPVALDARLYHVLQDTIYAESTYGLDLGWFPLRRWRLGAGWDWSRLVLGGEAGQRIGRHTARFSLARTAPSWHRAGRGWAGRVEVATTSGWNRDIRRGSWKGRTWFGLRGMGVWVGHEAGVVAGADSLLRVDAFAVGGAASLRGTYEGAYRNLRYLLVRQEAGVRAPGPAGARFYLLADLAWMRPWKPIPGTQFGRPDRERFLHSFGCGLEVPTRAGEVSLDYAVLKGRSLAQGRIHLHLTSRF